MRAGQRFPPHVWAAFEKTFAEDTQAALDPRHSDERFRCGYGMGMYWETISRWIPQRAMRDARALGVPVVFLQAADECNTIDRAAAARLLNVPNPHNTGHIHGVLPGHVGMWVRFLAKYNGTLGLVQEQRGKIVDFLFHEFDAQRYRRTAPGEIFKPRYMPEGLWLQLDGFERSPIAADLLPYLQGDPEAEAAEDAGPGPSLPLWRQRQREQRARGLFLLRPMDVEFPWRSGATHQVKRTGFTVSHAAYLTATASQGQTLRAGVTIDCARLPPQGRQGTSDSEWWLNLYVMFSRATQMSDMLLLRPPPRQLLEAGPPASVRRALQRFEEKRQASVAAATALAAAWEIDLPPE